MPRLLLAAMNRLVEVLEGENAALAAMDLPRAAAMLPEKTDALAALAAAGGGAREHPGLLPAARRVDDLARKNRHLLERAIVAQQRVIGVVAAAAASITAEPFYGASGRQTRAAGPVALSTRV